MKVEAMLFAGVAAFFGVVTAVYVGLHPEPAGTAALVVSFLMSLLISFFLWLRHLRQGVRPQDRQDAAVRDGAGPLAFFSPRSYFPALTALGTAVAGTGVIFGLWLFVVGIGLVAAGIGGFVFQHNDR
jgi:hypothetical protein